MGSGARAYCELELLAAGRDLWAKVQQQQQRLEMQQSKWKHLKPLIDRQMLKKKKIIYEEK